MLSPPGRAGEHAAELAKELGIIAGETMPSYGWGRPAVVGATGDLANELKAYGARWSSRDQALVFPTWSALESVLLAVLKERKQPPSG